VSNPTCTSGGGPRISTFRDAKLGSGLALRSGRVELAQQGGATLSLSMRWTGCLPVGLPTRRGQGFPRKEPLWPPGGLGCLIQRLPWAAHLCCQYF
jgi:hypothetical protein